MTLNIAIDGPSGAGKSTVAREVAKKLGCIYVDTGAMYRSIALYCIENDVDVENKDLVIQQLEYINIQHTFVGSTQCILLNGVDVTTSVRDQAVGNSASKIATIQKVRDILVTKQRNIASKERVVMDGRDIGTKVLIDAKFKFFLDASVEDRSVRRVKELEKNGVNVEYNTIFKEIYERDVRDYNRKSAPLVKADDAIYIDSSNYTVGEVVEKIFKIVNLS